MTTLTEVVTHPAVREDFAILTDAAESAASPQIRNQGTLGGNVSQDTRCWYYRGGWNCYRAGGNICYADTPTAVNREHAIFDADRRVAVNPSDTAPALVALDASMVIKGPKGERVVPAEEYWIGHGIDITRMNVLQPGELLTAIRIPATMADAQFYFEKVRDRQVWYFPLVRGRQQITTTLKADGGTLSGSIAGGRGGEVAIKEGTISGSTLKFKSTQQGRGGEINMSWSGTVKGDEIAFTRTIEGGQAPA